MATEILFHNHRIIPGHMGGEYTPRNTLRVNVALHAYLHKLLWEQHGKIEDKNAWQILIGLIGKENLRKARRWATPEQRAAHSAFMQGKKYALGNRLTDPQRAKISASLKGNKRSLGHSHPQSPETRAKISATRKAQPEEVKRRISEELKARPHQRGYRHTPEALAKISAASRAHEQRKRDARGK